MNDSNFRDACDETEAYFDALCREMEVQDDAVPAVWPQLVRAA